MNAGIRRLPLTLILLLLAAAGGLTIYNLAQQLPPAQWGGRSARRTSTTCGKCCSITACCRG